jgi:transcription elongation factor Elf1
MTDVNAHIIEFQCPKCGQPLEQTIGKLKSQDQMRCPGCGISINIDTSKLSNAVEEIRKAIEHAPPEITIKFFR